MQPGLQMNSRKYVTPMSTDMSRTLSSLYILLLLALSTPVLAAGLSSKDAWIREAPPVSRVLAGYIEIINDSDKPATLVHVTSNSFAKIELHQTRLENGLATMQRQDSITVPAKGSVLLEPEGMHMMLFNPVKPFKAGNTLQLELRFRNGNTMPVEFVVKKASGPDHSHHHMHH